MSRILIDRHGIRTTLHWNDDDTFTVESEQDVEPIIDRNKAAANENKKNTRGRDVFPVASIPVTVQYEWAKRYGITNIFDEQYWPKVKRLLNDPEWRYLRTSEIIL